MHTFTLTIWLLFVALIGFLAGRIAVGRICRKGNVRRK